MWTNPQKAANLLGFTKHVFNGKLYLVPSVGCELPVNLLKHSIPQKKFNKKIHGNAVVLHS